VVEAYLKIPQADGPIYALVGFQRVHLTPGASRDVSLELSPRSLSAVDSKGQRSILPGAYHLSIGSTQPAESASKSEADFTVIGTVALPK
jgi:beta-glucosidase